MRDLYNTPSKYFKFICLIIFVIVSFPFSVYADTIPIIGGCESLNSTDLSTQMAYEIDSRIDGIVASDTTKMLWSTRGNGVGGWERNGTVWTAGGATSLDFTGASPWNNYSGMTLGATLISPKHIAFANHSPIINGSTVIFVDSANNIISRTVVDQIQVAGDIRVGVLNQDMPPEIVFYPIVDFTTFRSYWKTVHDTPVIILDQEDKALIKNVSGIVDDLFYFEGSSTFPRNGFNENIISGDSSNPIFGVVGGRPVVLSTVYTAGSGTSFSYFVDEINSAMTMLGGGYQVSTLDLSCFTPQSAPIFSVELMTLFVAENSANGTEVGSVLATSNDPFTYSFIYGNTDNVFVIDANTGAIAVNDQSLLNYESTSFYTLTLKAQVVDSPWYWPIIPGYDTMTVIVNLTDINEAPVFFSPSYSFSIVENSSSLSSVGSVSATDPDAGQTISYEILSGNTNETFSISSTTGEITVMNQSFLDYETTQSYNLVIKVSDDGDIPLFVTVPVTINITNIDEGGGSSGGGGGGGGNAKKKKITPVPINTICRVGDKFSTITGLPCTSFILSQNSGPLAILQNLGSSACFFTQTLRIGSRGDQVKCLQTKLGIISDGIFGPMTKVAVILFQKNHNLVPDGIFGPKSRAFW